MAKKRKYTKEVLEEVVKKCFSVREIILYFGLKETGGNYSNFKKLIEEYELSIEHFHGQLWAKGKTVLDDDRTKNIFSKKDVFSENSKKDIKHFSRDALKKIIEYKCQECGISNKWNGKEIKLELDHINGNHYDNRLENLRFLCPNCHSQTNTYKNRGRNGKKKEKIDKEKIIESIKSSKTISEVLRKNDLINKTANYNLVRKIMIENKVFLLE